MDPSDGVYSLGKRSSWAGKTLVLTVFSLKSRVLSSARIVGMNGLLADS